MLDVRNGGGVLSLTRSIDPPRSITAAPWISCVKASLGRDIDHVLIGARRIGNPEHCKLIAVWTSPYISRGARPVSEAFNSVLKVEYVHRHTFRTRAGARIRIATRITGFYNTRRLHSVCDFKSPIDYEREYWAGLTVGLAA
ncbi:hypothetical protein ACFCX0_47430 [Streptomyces sp. NPDC056352]|uniref:hypothetical protein n=1 Tax=Streptomyces sp. NPDC056352 TaxID=3345791 RepID=UPI0035E2D42A